MTIKEILQKNSKSLARKKITSASIDAQILLLHSLSKSKNKPKMFNNDRSWLVAHNEYNLTKTQENTFNKLIKRRKKFEPIAYITEKKEFFGIEFKINKNVLIPRPETEIIAEESIKEIISKLKLQLNNKKKIVIADIGTGSGAIAIAIAKTLIKNKQINKTQIYATDISTKALNVAKINSKKHNCTKNIIFKKGNLLKAIPKNIKIDFLLANLPYIENDYYYHNKYKKNYNISSGFNEIKYEPKNALLAKNNGLEYFNKFFPEIPNHITNNTKIFLESSPSQIPLIKKLAKKYLPKHKTTIIKDLRKLNRITKIEII